MVRSNERTPRLGFRVSLAGVLAVASVACSGAPGEQAREDGAEVSSSISAAVPGCGTRFVDATGGADDLGGAPNGCRVRATPCLSLQHAVDVACAGDTVRAARGEYRENVVVTKALTLAGEGRGTIVYPAVSNPACSGDSLCGGAASNVFLVQASGVTLRDLTIDGDNPSLTSGVVRGGADIDARNGIITNHLAGTFDDLVVRGVEVRNIYLRGIYASSGGSFRFERDVVRNVQGDATSVAIFDFAGAGVIAQSYVDAANDAISANHSRGTLFVDNVVRASGSGVHTDNAGDSAGAGADRLEGNDVGACTANGYGVWVFVPHLPISVVRNRVHGCDIAMADFGQGAAVTTRFADNDLRGPRTEGSIGALVTNDGLGFSPSNAAAALVGNAIRGFDVGVSIVELPGLETTVSLRCNRIRGNRVGVQTGSASTRLRDDVIARNGVGVDATAVASGVVDARDNWWGCSAGTPAPGCDTTVGSVDAADADWAPPRCALDGARDAMAEASAPSLEAASASRPTVDRARRAADLPR